MMGRPHITAFVGAAVVMMMAPASAFRPYNEPCGPFRTSIWAMSNRCVLNCFESSWGTPSTITATGTSELLACVSPRSLRQTTIRGSLKTDSASIPTCRISGW